MAKGIEGKSKESLRSGMSGLKTKDPEPRGFISRREGRRIIYETTFICQIIALATLFIAFCSPYWIVSWPRVHSTFKKMGLWEACFAGMILPFDPSQKSYHGCWWILAPEYVPIRSWLMPGWYVFTQVAVTVCFVAELINLLIIFIIWIRTGGMQKDGKAKDKDPVALVQTSCFITASTAILMSATVIIFGTCFFTDRQWLPNPHLNYPSWSYGLAIVSSFFSIFASICHITYVMIIRHRLRRPPRAVPPPTGYYLAPRHDTSFGTTASTNMLSTS